MNLTHLKHMAIGAGGRDPGRAAARRAAHRIMIGRRSELLGALAGSLLAAVSQ